MFLWICPSYFTEMELFDMWPCLASFINAMISRSFQVLAPIRTPFLPMDECFIMCRHLFIHSATDIWTGSDFWLLLRLSTETVYKFLFEYTFSVPWGIHLAEEFLSRIVILWLTCRKAAWFTLWPPCYLPTSTGVAWPQAHPHWNLFCCWKLVGVGENVEKMEGFHTVSKNYWDSHHETLNGSSSKS